LILELKDVTRQYHAPDGQAGPAVLRGVSMSLEAGQSLALVGPSGCGKSTLLNIIGGLDRPTSGSVVFDGAPMHALDERKLAHVRNQRIGFVFQLHPLLSQLTALENVLVPTLASPGASAEASGRERAQRLLERVGLADRIGYRPGQLSGGQRQRVAIARALVNAPGLLLADEPTGSLDHEAASNIAHLLGELCTQEGVAVILATHNMELAGMMGRVMKFRDGRLQGLEAA
jgi:ABC-type lipoprotein export system ATPase subunit